MQKFQIISLLAIIIIGSSCDKISKLTQFDLEYNETIQIPASSLFDIPLDIKTPDIKTNTEQSFVGNNTSKEYIESIKLSKMELSITSPVDGTFGFLKSITVYISAESLNELEIASKKDISENIGNFLELDTTEEDLKEYILKDSFDLRIKTVFDEITTTDHSIDMHTVFLVDAKVLGF